MFQTTFVLVAALCCAISAVAQVQPQAIGEGATTAWQALLRLRTTATVLHTTAHPDDEDGAMLVWLTRNQGARTGLLTLNRGEGGADLIGPELFDALGLVRTEELLAAGRYYGVNQFFTRVTDFGFSKRMDETLEHWGKENVLRDVVRVVRMYRPDILISRFHGKPRDGHGNHQTAGLMSHEVFEAAADPSKFPELNLPPWQIRKLYVSVRDNEPRTVVVDVGAYDALLGMSYRQAASAGLNFQRSQGAGGRRADPGPGQSSWQIVKTALGATPPSEQTVFDGIDTSLTGLAKLAPALNLVAELAAIQSNVDRAIAEFDARTPSTVVEAYLAPSLKTLRAVLRKAENAKAPEDLLFRLRNKQTEFVTAANRLLSLSLDATVDPPRGPEGAPEFFRSRETFQVAIPGQKFSVTATLVNRGAPRITPVSVEIQTPTAWQVAAKPAPLRTLGFNEVWKAQFDLTVPDDAPYTRPYWSRNNLYRDHIYQIDKPEYLNRPHAPPEVVARVTYELAGERFTIQQPVQTVYRDGPMGEQRRQLTIAPAISVAINPKLGVILAGSRTEPIAVRVRAMSNAKTAAKVTIQLDLPAGWTATPPQADALFSHEGEVQNIDFKVKSTSVVAGKEYRLQAVATYAGKEYREGYQIIGHRDLETRHLYKPAAASWSGIDVKVAPGLMVGYIMGVGDEIPEALEQIGVKPQMLSAQDLATANLSQYDTILVGIRASAVREDYKTYNRRLLDYVQNGGNLIVQYQTQEFDAVPYGPYPFKMGRRAEEVSEEDSKVTILDPANPIFQAPNKITLADFDGWIEERGSKFMSEWDPRYKALLECHDRSQEQQKGGMLQAKYGKGTFTYAAYAFYRQLPAGIPGAYKLFANMISLGKTK